VSTIHQARKDIRYLASLVRGLLALDEELEKAGGLDAFLREKGNTLEALERADADLVEKRATLSMLDQEISERQGRLDAIEAQIKSVRDRLEGSN
jgi:hypothetical protein